jgi:hemerythrin-like domain-containing protein
MIAPMTATAALREEHVLILKALDLLEAAATQPIEDGAGGDAWATLLDWLHGFADARHHAKEECWLFPALEVAGVPHQNGPLAVMLAEHEQGRGLIRALREAPSTRRSALAREYAQLLRAHIDKENEILFELADAVLEPGAVQEVVRAYAAADAEHGAALAPEAAEATLQRLAVVLTPRADVAPAASRR